MGWGREPWEQSEAGGVNDDERHLRHSPVSSPTEELRKDKRRSDDSGRRERTRPGLLVCVLCVAVVREGLPLFCCVCLFLLNLFKCSPVPASFFPFYELCYIPHGRLPHTKHKLKSRPGPLSSSTVVAPPFILPELLHGTRDR